MIPKEPRAPDEGSATLGAVDEELGLELGDLLRQVARADPVRPEDLAAALARRDLVGQRVGHFRVVERLGAGGVGVVYLAEDTRLARRVALKVLGADALPPSRPGEDGAAPAAGPDIHALLHEARAAAAITHPNVAAVYEAGDADGIAYIAMEYVDGVTLRSRVARGPLPIADVVRYARQIADGLSKAHERGVVHRDLKPDNVMVDRDDRVKILDFGLARPAPEPGVTRDSGAMTLHRGTVAGTPVYMSPEQARGAPVDPRSDVFSFGVLVYEALTGRAPFGDRTQDRSQWTFEARAPLTRLRPDTPPELCAVVERCLATSRSGRYASGAELAQALAATANGSEDGTPVRARWAVIVGAAVGVAASLSAAVVGWTIARDAPRTGSSTMAAPPDPPRAALRRLTANISENQVVSAALSPDGETLAFVDRTGLSLEPVGGAAAHFDLGARGVPGQPQVVAWFADGARLAVCTLLPGAPDRDAQQVWIVARSGGAPPRRVARGSFTGIAPSPDGARIAFAADDTVGWIAADDTDGPSHVLTKREGCFISELAWSPDGGRIAYASLCFDSLARTAIESVPVAGGAPTVAVADPHLYSSFVRAAGVLWTQAGELIYPRAEWLPAEPGSSLWSVAVDASTGAATGSPRALTSWVGVGAAALSADRSASRIAFIRFEEQADVYVGALSDGGRKLGPPRRLTLTNRNERPSAWTRDGRSVYFFSDASGNFDILLQDLAGGPARPFAADAEWETSAQLTPDGRSLLYWRFPAVASDEAVNPEIVRRPVEGGPPVHVATARTLAHPAGAGRPAPWETRMRCPKVAAAPCILSEQLGEDLVFSELDPVRGRGDEVRRQHATMSATFWDVSPDGARLAIPRSYGPIVVQPLARGAAPLELPVAAGCDPLTPTWSADGKGLFVNVDCDTDDSPFRLYYVGLDGKTTLLWKDPSLYVLEAEPSPDGEHLAVAVKTSHDDVWMLDGVTR